MRIAANLGVMDEVELIEQCIAQLRTIGVDLIVVTDVGSTDGTLEILRALSRGPDFCLIETSPENLWGFPGRMYERTVAEFEVDRVLLLDADEFWIPRTGNLKDTVGLEATDVLRVERFNVPPVRGVPLLPDTLSPAAYDRLFLVAKPVEQPWLEFQRRPNLASIMTRVVPKCILDPARVAGFAMGGHRPLEKHGIKPTTKVPGDLLIAHAPFSTYTRFLRKLQNIEKTISLHGHLYKAQQAWHWRRWLALAEEGKAEEEFSRQLLTQEQFSQALAEGTIQSAKQWFEQGGEA
jgi:hypothetical protein